MFEKALISGFNKSFSIFMGEYQQKWSDFFMEEELQYSRCWWCGYHISRSWLNTKRAVDGGICWFLMHLVYRVRPYASTNYSFLELSFFSYFFSTIMVAMSRNRVLELYFTTNISDRRSHAENMGIWLMTYDLWLMTYDLWLMTNNF